MFTLAMQIGYHLKVLDDRQVAATSNFKLSETNGILIVVIGLPHLQPFYQTLVMHQLNFWREQLIELYALQLIL